MLFLMQISEDFFFAWKVPHEDQNVNCSQNEWSEIVYSEAVDASHIQYNQNLITLCDVAVGC